MSFVNKKHFLIFFIFTVTVFRTILNTSSWKLNNYVFASRKFLTFDLVSLLLINFLGP